MNTINFTCDTIATSTVLDAIRQFVDARPGFDRMNYDSERYYQADYRPVLRAKHDAHKMLAYITWSSINVDDLKRASEYAWSGRLMLDIVGDTATVDYCVGQYAPTEERPAVCAVLAYAIRQHWRECGYSDIKKQAKKQFGAGIANRWFS